MKGARATKNGTQVLVEVVGAPKESFTRLRLYEILEIASTTFELRLLAMHAECEDQSRCRAKQTPAVV